MRRVGSVLVALASLFACDAARAQGSYRSMPTGGRSALMGNTGVALARDGAAPFLNPATIVDIGETRVALSFNFYSVTTTSLHGLHAPRAPGSELGRTQLTDLRADALPSTFCLFFTIGPELERVTKDALAERKLAFCVGTSERRDLFLTETASARGPNGQATLHLASLERRWGRVHVGPTYGRSFGEHLAVGASLHLVDTSSTAVTTASASGLGGPGTASTYASTVSATSYDLQMLLGATLRFDRHTTLALAAAPPSLHVAGNMDASEHTQSLAPGTSDFARTRAGEGTFMAPLPARVALGIGRWTPKLRIEADLTYFFPLAAGLRSDLDVRSVTQVGSVATDRTARETTEDRFVGVLDSAVGAEAFLSETISLLGGFATDFGALTRLGADPPLGSVATTREQRFVASLGLGSYGTGSELLFGAQLALSRGQALVADSFSVPGALAPVERNSTTVLFVVAGSTSLRQIRHALDDLRRTLPSVR
jgi:hypothetical protein